MQAAATSASTKDFTAQRQTMVDCQIRTFDVTDPRIVARFLEVPRERFVPDHVSTLAYSDIGFVVPAAAPEEEARYLLPPLVLARLIQGARPRAGDHVLDVAPGPGYSTAILSGLVRSVVALESDASLCQDLSARLAAYGAANVTTHQGSLADGVPEAAPFDVILVNGAVQVDPTGLFDQLAEGGRLAVIRRLQDDPTGRASKAMCYEKRQGVVSGRFLFDAVAPALRAFQAKPHFVF
jgi:protein-L-isoaspartate(D-aspartate) O-methyltransferase